MTGAAQASSWTSRKPASLFTELDDFLREKLGHDTHITGEVVRTASGVSLTARAGGAGAETATGAETDLDALVQKSAEADLPPHPAFSLRHVSGQP